MDTLLIEQYANTEDLYITIPRQLLERLECREGDQISWEIQKDGTIKIEKANSEEDYYNSESEGKEFKDFDERYDEYIQTTSQENYFYSPEENGTWNGEENNFGFD
jgi:antitoxin component of MazEF toxin-antitoxin module